MSVSQQWLEFHRNNPDVWAKFCGYADQAYEKRSKWGARMTWERLRWYANIETDSNDEWKLNNNYPPYYGRLYNLVCHEGFFETRCHPRQDLEEERNEVVKQAATELLS